MNVLSIEQQQLIIENIIVITYEHFSKRYLTRKNYISYL